MEIRIEVTPELLDDRIRELEHLQKNVGHMVISTIGIRAKITLAEYKSIPRSEGKAKRVIDLRGKPS